MEKNPEIDFAILKKRKIGVPSHREEFELLFLKKQLDEVLLKVCPEFERFYAVIVVLFMVIE
ncbi:MAG: hypothetical protein PF690_05815 [Deltaproteobacteria bacterium]|nr:hypothetical protein [Deltaproteobacteria bacterium]